jgi:DNA-binding NarL/FixJ family response regulator
MSSPRPVDPSCFARCTPGRAVAGAGSTNGYQSQATQYRSPSLLAIRRDRYATELLAEGSASVGYLLKDRVAEVGEFVDAIARVAAGGTALDPQVVSLLGRATAVPHSTRR